MYVAKNIFNPVKAIQFERNWILIIPCVFYFLHENSEGQMWIENEGGKRNPPTPLKVFKSDKPTIDKLTKEKTHKFINMYMCKSHNKYANSKKGWMIKAKIPSSHKKVK